VVKDKKKTEEKKRKKVDIQNLEEVGPSGLPPITSVTPAMNPQQQMRKHMDELNKIANVPNAPVTMNVNGKSVDGKMVALDVTNPKAPMAAVKTNAGKTSIISANAVGIKG